MKELEGAERPAVAPSPIASVRSVAPRLGFAGAGWIGRHRMKSISDSGAGIAAVIADPAGDLARVAAAEVECVRVVSSFAEMLDHELDGVVIATPSALHADQAVAALSLGIPVFCQKPLGRNAAETRRVIDAARDANRLLGVDFSYRDTSAMRAVRNLVQEGTLGTVYAADLVFHNAYGPDKPWFYDPALSGGGCVIDLGIHLVDLALWVLDFPEVTHVTSRLFAGGRPIPSIAAGSAVEDYAIAELKLATGGAIRIACSWNLPAGQDAVIEASFFGTSAGASMKNVDGSFYDFTAEVFHGTRRECIARPPDAWGGRAGIAWARQLVETPAFDPEIVRAADVAHLVDRIYQR